MSPSLRFDRIIFSTLELASSAYASSVIRTAVGSVKAASVALHQNRLRTISASTISCGYSELARIRKKHYLLTRG